jgi:hypothetical protein
VLLGGCAALLPRGTGPEPVAYLTQALAADAGGREALWRGLPSGDDSPSAQLRVALLQSLPLHSGHDPAAARRRLDALASHAGAPHEVAAVARLRLAQMDEIAECRNEADELRQRLGRVVDIERRLNRSQ